MKRISRRNIIGEFSFLPPAGEQRTYRLLRSWTAILVVGALLACFSIPLLMIGAQMDFSGIDDLFSLVFLLFNLFWMLGWSVAVVILAVVFLAMVFGRERLIFTPGRLMDRLEIFGMGFTRFLDSTDLGEFAWLETPDPDSGISWRDSHVTVAYKGELVSLGTNITETDASELQHMLETIVLPDPPPDDKPREFVRPPAKSGDTAVKISANATVTNRPSDDVAQQDAISSFALVAANLIPVFGVLFMDWRVGEVMLLYWAESAVIGVYNIARMWVIGRWSVLLQGPFFIGHYGGFMVVHLLFIYSFVIEDMDSLVATTLQQVFQDFVALAPALLAFFASHGVSFYRNFLGRREYIGRTVSGQMNEPYKRIIVMHVTIIFGGFLVLAFESAVPVLILMIALKIGVDLRAHHAQHKG